MKNTMTSFLIVGEDGFSFEGKFDPPIRIDTGDDIDEPKLTIKED